MQPKIFVSPDKLSREESIWSALKEFKIELDNPDLLIIDDDKVGVAQIKTLIRHLSTKPFGKTIKAAVILNGEGLSLDAQNALLKILEEPPGESVILIGTDTENKLLPTVLSRCLVVSFQPSAISSQLEFNLDKILKASLEERFEIVEKTDNKDQFLQDLVQSYRQKTISGDVSGGFLDDCLQAQIWREANVNIRTILEYLMLRLKSD